MAVLLLAPAAAQAQGAAWSAKTPASRERPATRLQHRSSLKLSVGFARAGGRRAAASPVTATGLPTVVATNYSCAFASTTDTVAYTWNYAPGLWSDSSMCSGKGLPSEGMGPFPSNGAYCPTYGDSVADAQGDYDGFADAEYEFVCNTPDDNGMGSSNANSVVDTTDSQTFTCQATVGVGPNDQTARTIKNTDSIEFSQNYTNYNNQSASAITTGCVGEVPAGVRIATTTVTHVVGCSQFNPFVAGKYVAGEGISVTYPDRQYAEQCNTPEYLPMTP
jgi:hypothetical protein